jgi:hypothetical protein
MRKLIIVAIFICFVNEHSVLLLNQIRIPDPGPVSGRRVTDLKKNCGIISGTRKTTEIHAKKFVIMSDLG